MQQRKAYLSIDLDYWQKEDTDKACRRFFEQVFSLGLPITVVDSHERMLQAVNKSKANVLYQVDYHSDFSGCESAFQAQREAKEKPEDGTWINYVKWRKEGELYWFYPLPKCYGSMQVYKTPKGYSRGSGVCWVNAEQNPFRKGTYKEWKTIQRARGHSGIDWSIIVGVGVSLSADYLVRIVSIYTGPKKDLHKNVKPFEWAVSKLGVRQRLINSFVSNTQGSKWMDVVHVNNER